MDIPANSSKRRNPRHHDHKLPVTALAFFSSDTLLSGEGNYLCVYATDDTKCLSVTPVFESQAIHGITIISSSNGWILIHGGRYICLASLKVESSIVRLDLGKTIELGDWILSIAAQPSAAGQPIQAGVVTAHDALHILTVKQCLEDSNEPLVSLSLTLAGNRTILYTAEITWQTSEHILVASGTAFGDIIVWSYHIDPDVALQPEDRSRRKIHYNFSAHEGSVFDVKFSPSWFGSILTESPLALLSCSDDRTIQLWNVSDLPNRQSLDEKAARDTGFGTAQNGAIEFRPHLLAKVMGHQSRIWHVRFVQPTNNDLLIQSFGEDATSLTWSIVPSPAIGECKYELLLRDTVSVHHGKHIWSVAHDEDSWATGGSDGAIALTRTSHESTATTNVLDIDLNEPKEQIRSYALIGEHTLVATTSAGQIIVVELRLDGPAVLERYNKTTLRGFSVVTSAGDVAFIAGNGGAGYAYCAVSRTLSELTIESGKTTGLYANLLNSTSGQEIGEISLLTTKVTSSTALVRILHTIDGEIPVQCAKSLALPAGEVVTSSQQAYIDDGTLVSLLGCRNGLLLVYFIDVRTAEVSDTNVSMSYQQHTEAITSIKWKTDRAETGHFFTTSRDGTYAIQRLHYDNQAQARVELLHQLELPFGSNIEGIQLDSDQHLLVWSFQSKHFVVYSASKQQEIMKVECGGAHRNWSFTPNTTNDGGTFAWTKASSVYYHKQISARHTIFNFGGHGREVKSTAISTARPRLLATGAEDTDIRLHLINDTASAHAADSSYLRCFQLLRKHNTGPQHLAFSADSTRLFSSGGFEELFIWRLHYDCPAVDIGVHLESAHPRCGKSDLRITTFRVKEHIDHLEFILAYSDSSLAIWSYGEGKEGRWTQKVRADYLTSVPTDVFLLSSRTANGTIVTTSTDGHLTSWSQSSDNVDDTKALSWQNRTQIHQSAILSACELGELPDGSRLLLTGGDDNAVAAIRIAESTGELLGTIIERDAHAAAVTALLGQTHLIFDANDPHRFNIHILSAGLDQRLIVWRLQGDVSDRELTHATLTKLLSIHTNVADVSGLVTAQDSWQTQESITVIITGIGTEVLEIPLS